MATFPGRYVIYLADLNPTVGGEIRKVRPVVVCPLTTVLHPEWRSRLQVECAGKKAEVAVDQIRAISKQRIGRRLDRLPAEEAGRLRRIITEMYGES